MNIHHDIVAPLLGAPIIVKKEADSFFETYHEALLKDNGVTGLNLTDMITQHYVTHTALSQKAHGLKVHIIAKGYAAPMKALSKMVLYVLKIRFSVE
ncbi:isochorismatase family protein [Pantoea vagans]|uniref:isochorismatase family protein n=1 Tax=Pantoea vagans TaxID=470934 RepID=UPI0028E70605|nr:isochorismatase family protein [Pantoea vagans]